MRKPFYSRLALTNLMKNRSMYSPYLLAGTVVTGLYYTLSSITQMVLDSGMEGGSSMGFILMMSAAICGIISLAILFYLNGFIMKRRKRELGLYSILGMEKRHICIVLAFECAINGLLCIAGGIVGGALLSQLLFLVLLKMIGIKAELVFHIPLTSVAGTALLFVLGFLAVYIYNVLSVYRTNTISMLRSDKEGEREPRSRWLIAACGVLTLGGGYALALAVRTASDALSVFFAAVLLVIAGTYCLFTAGSIVLLKLLRKNKCFYYKPGNFISVSGMIYRMKQNAAGLSNICILSTCVLVTLSSTLCLYLGEEDILRSRYPQQVQLRYRVDTPETPAEAAESAVASHARKYGFAVENTVSYAHFYYPSTREADSFPIRGGDGRRYDVTCLTAQDYGRITGSAQLPGPSQALVYATGDPIASGTLTLAGRPYEVIGDIDIPAFLNNTAVTDTVIAVLPDITDLLALAQEMGSAQGEAYRGGVIYDYRFDLEGDGAQLAPFYETLDGAAAHPQLRSVDSIDTARGVFYELYGSLMFVGIFFIILFLIATILIIYYKQITEGFDDHDRFQIMEKVGMSDKEVRQTIKKQVLLVFYLPLWMAVVHVAVAFPVLCKLLLVFNMTNRTLFFLCTLSTILVFAALYYFVYQRTARTYYKIVQETF